MKVLQVTERYHPAIGGVESHVANLSKQLVALGTEVTVLTTDLESVTPFVKLQVAPPAVTSEGIGVIRTEAFKMLPLPVGLGVISPGMVRHLAGHDLVHCHGYGRFPTFLAPICSAMSIPCVITTHSDKGRGSLAKMAFDAIVPRLTLDHAERVIAISSHEAKALSTLGVPRGKIVTIPNGVEPPRAEKDWTKRLGRRRVVFAGRVDLEHKGVDVLVRAFSILTGKVGNLELRILGPDGGGLRRVKSLVHDMGLDDLVAYRGVLSREDLAQELARADVVAVPSRFEPFGIVILEAMSVGTPVVASAVAGPRELIQDGIDGMLAEPGSTDALASKLELVLSDDSFARRLSSAAKRKAAKYSWADIAERTLEVYRSVIAGRR